MQFEETAIREAIQLAGHKYAEHRIMRYLKSRQTFADADTVTVRELREAFQRILPDDCCRICGAKFHAGDIPSEYLLQVISENREAERT